MVSQLPCIHSSVRCAGVRLPVVQGKAAAHSQPSPPAALYATLPASHQRWRASCAGVEEQYLMEAFQTDAGIVETVDSSDDEVIAAFVRLASKMLVFLTGSL
jgi:hypothetical protein